MATKCKRCGAPIIWIETEAGKWMPANEGLVPYKQDDSGVDYVITDWGELIRCNLQFDGYATGMARRPHWATCPFAAEFRRLRGR